MMGNVQCVRAGLRTLSPQELRERLSAQRTGDHGEKFSSACLAPGIVGHAQTGAQDAAGPSALAGGARLMPSSSAGPVPGVVGPARLEAQDAAGPAPQGQRARPLPAPLCPRPCALPCWVLAPLPAGLPARSLACLHMTPEAMDHSQFLCGRIDPSVQHYSVAHCLMQCWKATEM